MRRMKCRPLWRVQIGLVFAAFLLSIGICSERVETVRAASSGPYVNAKAAIVYDATTRKVLYDKQADTPMYPASTTKLMTAILLVQHLDPDAPIYIGTEAAHQPKVRLGVKPGTTIAADDALRALLMKSANDVAFGIAQSVGGSQAGFARMMNVEARMLGCTHTRFVTPNGLHADAHTTSARDIALILAEAVKYPRIVEAMQTKSHTVAGKSINNTNRILYNSSAAIGEYIGGKTGFTSKAMYCLATATRQHGHVRISVVFGAPRKSLMYRETIRLLTWSNKHFPADDVENKQAPSHP
ncbi:D-alanyl-D-alanine carboxypeptidase family protein [Alicyclobacillus dauci]|uniref:D-alanyl-D-alanine carboxypeptidase n=1 Tax=Alicyclobacillus dauci TaxID=1475485 RepID=A0ABY6Z887_9BACL|nr:D-alanyl-D-alanine carboxypeptidase family protein [Alicyclobacillus dauci]WAH38459.1 D-alanyl-D-alanine carboxypeptidase [Alicyclobacillus dauci]